MLALRFWVLPDIERYREDIVAAASRGLGMQVRIGAIEAGWMGLRPRVSLSDVRIYDAQGREALVLPAVDNVIAWRSLLHAELRLHTVVIDSPRLAVRRDAAGAFYVAGIKLGGSGGENAAGGLLDLGEIVVRNAEIEWRDEQRGAPPLVLWGLDLHLSTARGRLVLGLAARPPAALGSSIQLRARLEGRSLAGWSGRVYLELGHTDLAAWGPWVDLPLVVRRGEGALRAWLTLEQGQLKEGTADAAISDLRASLGDELEPLDLASLHGRVRWRDLPDGVDLSGRGLALVLERGPEIPRTDFQIIWRPGKGGTVGASLVDLQGIGRLIESLPLPPQIRLRLAELAARGRLADLRFEWTGPFDAPQRFSGRTRFADLAMGPRRTVPGFAGLSGSLEATEAGGRLQLSAKGAALEFPEVLAERVAFESLAGELTWESSAGGLALRVGSLSFANAHLGGSLSGSYTRRGEGPGILDLSATLARADGAQLARYLPLPSIMGEATHAWLARAVVSGQMSDVRLRLRGDLREFPFADPARGQFQVSARVAKGVLDYAEGWPRIEDIACELLFERSRMEVVGRSASIFGARLSNVRVSIPTFSDPHVLVSGQADGPVAEFLRYIESSPVREMTGGATSGMQATGRGRLRLKLDLPLADLATTRVAGDYEFTASELKAHPALAPIERARGRLEFSDSGFTLHELRGRQFGGPMTASGGTRAGGVEIAMRGEASVAAMRELFDHPAAANLSGSFTYDTTVGIKDGLVRASLESSLVGVESALPPPLAKRAADALPLRIEVAPADGERDRISVALGDLVRAVVTRRPQGAAMAMERAAIWVSPEGDAAVRQPEKPGTLVYGSLPSLDLDRWLPLFGGGGEEFAQAVALDLKFGTLDAFGRRLTKVALRASAQQAGWSANVAAEELAGEVSYRGEAGGKVVARLAHFRIPEDAPGAQAQGGAKPGQLPVLDLAAEEFTFRGKHLGRVELVASPAGEDLRIERASMMNADGSLSGHGLWHGAPPRTDVSFVLHAGDIGAFLERVGYPNLVKGGTADLQGSLAWNGDPGSLDFPTLGGEIQLQAAGGQFLEIDPGGVGKLLSLMSLQALPKRITLDFRDVFSKGFQFDRITSAAQVQRGVLTLKEMRMRGSAADVAMTGKVDLAHETQDLKVRIVPGIGLGDSAALGIALINPIAGAAAALAQRLLQNPLGQLLAFDYSVSGSWADPKVEKIVEPSLPLTPQEPK